MLLEEPRGAEFGSHPLTIVLSAVAFWLLFGILQATGWLVTKSKKLRKEDILEWNIRKVFPLTVLIAYQDDVLLGVPMCCQLLNSAYPAVKQRNTAKSCLGIQKLVKSTRIICLSQIHPTLQHLLSAGAWKVVSNIGSILSICKPTDSYRVPPTLQHHARLHSLQALYQRSMRCSSCLVRSPVQHTKPTQPHAQTTRKAFKTLLSFTALIHMTV